MEGAPEYVRASDDEEACSSMAYEDNDAEILEVEESDGPMSEAESEPVPWAEEPAFGPGETHLYMRFKLKQFKSKYEDKYRQLIDRHLQEVSYLKEGFDEDRAEFQRENSRVRRQLAASERENRRLNHALAPDGNALELNDLLRTENENLKEECAQHLSASIELHETVDYMSERHDEERAQLCVSLIEYLCAGCRRRRVRKLMLECCHAFCVNCSPLGPVLRCPRCLARVTRVVDLIGWPVD